MTLELVVFVAAILFGILLYWRESNGNGFYRFINKLVNSKELQMKADDKTGFIYQQKFLLRLVFVTAFFLIVSLIVQFLTPFKIFSSINGTSMFASCIVGTLIGTYVAHFVIKSGDVIEMKTEDLGGIAKDIVEKSKDFVGEVKDKVEDLVDDSKGNDDEPEITSNSTETEEPNKEPEKSARERLKDKGLL